MPIALVAPPQAAAPAPPVGRRQLLPAWLTKPRSIPAWALVALVLTTCTISGAPSVISNVRVVAEGAPDAYLALLPLWALIIAMTADRRPRRHDVHDADVDRILAFLVAGLAIGCCQLVLRRIGAIGEFWHVHVLAVIAWVVAVSILKFGSRTAARTRVAWLFLLACFPPLFLLAGQALGGTRLAYGALTALYGAVAMFLALREREIRWAVAPVYFGLAFAGTLLLQNAPAPIAYLVPAVTLTTLTVVLFIRAPHRTGSAPIPQHSLFTVAVVIALSAGVGLVPSQPVSHTASSELMWVRPDWVKSLDAAGIAVGPAQTFDWGPRAMGDHGSVVRYPVTLGKTKAFIDVFSTRDYGRLTNYCCGLWYATAPPPDVEKDFISTDGVIRQVAEMGNQYSPPQKQGDPAWHAHHWLWRTKTPSAVVYQAVYLIASRDPKAPENVALPELPSLSTGILQPLAALIQDHAALHTPKPYDTAGLTVVTDKILSAAKGTPAG